MNVQNIPTSPAVTPALQAAPLGTVAALRERAPRDMRSAVLLSLIVGPRGGAAAHGHGQGARRTA